MEQSVAEFRSHSRIEISPSTGIQRRLEKGNAYTQKALALDPKDQYNLVFAAVFMAASGHGDEALKIAQRNRAMLPASYNLAAIYARPATRKRHSPC
jgi:hypothetical protein